MLLLLLCGPKARSKATEPIFGLHLGLINYKNKVEVAYYNIIMSILTNGTMLVGSGDEAGQRLKGRGCF